MVKKCEVCGEEFSYKSTRPNPRFCSRLCQNRSPERRMISSRNGSRNKGRLTGDNNPNWLGGPIVLKCLECGREFGVPKNELTGKKRSGKFCSHECHRASRLRNGMSTTQKAVHFKMKRKMTHAIRRRADIHWKALGYSSAQLLQRLESLFKEGMSWENYGEWHVDHIVPVSAFRFLSEEDEQFRSCWSLSNLQPLWAQENMRKGGVKRGIS